MNCEPGDLAIVSRAHYPADKRFIGCIVRVLRMVPHEIGGHPCWTYEGPLLRGIFGDVSAIDDAVLTPLRDPGEDARDEMLRPLPNSFEVYWQEAVR